MSKFTEIPGTCLSTLSIPAAAHKAHNPCLALLYCISKLETDLSTDSKTRAEPCQTPNGKTLNSILAININHGEEFIFFLKND